MDENERVRRQVLCRVAEALWGMWLNAVARTAPSIFMTAALSLHLNLYPHLAVAEWSGCASRSPLKEMMATQELGGARNSRYLAKVENWKSANEGELPSEVATQM